MVRRFHEITGYGIEGIYGQDRLAYALSDHEDFYDLFSWADRGGYPGSVILFYDLKTGGVYRPFEKRRNVMYGRPVYAEGYCYFLQCDYDAGIITLFRYIPGDVSQAVTQLSVKDTDLYNLQIMGEGIRIISQCDVFRCYYPERISFTLRPEETVCFMTDTEVYTESWIEEGWDDENHRASEDYRFYNKVSVRDYDGNILKEETGTLYRDNHGAWWIG